jgi:hypothetical protein
MNRMAGLEGNAEKYVGGGRVSARRRCKGVHPWETVRGLSIACELFFGYQGFATGVLRFGINSEAMKYRHYYMEVNRAVKIKK